MMTKERFGVRFSLQWFISIAISLYVEKMDRDTVDTSQSLIALSSDPDAKVLESGLHAMVDIPAR